MLTPDRKPAADIVVADRPAAPSPVRCRPIGDADLPAVAALLASGFPARPEAYWAAGLARLARRTVPEGAPRFGFMLDRGGEAVGAILVITQTITHAGAPFVRCNLASWYVAPDARSHAAMLSLMPFRQKGATFVNISAAPNTWATIEAMGFRRYTFGQRLALPMLARSAPGLRITRFTEADRERLPEGPLLADHAAAGCTALIGEAPEGPVPFVLLPYRARQGRHWLPILQLVYCRDLADVTRFAAPLGRWMARRGMPFLLHDAEPGVTALPGRFLPGRARKYAKGPHVPALGDLAYTEFTLFGS